mgnify:CR=1 FL=1
MLLTWIDHLLDLADTPADFYSGCRKILRNVRLTFDDMDTDLQMKDAGYTSSKMTMLTKNYFHGESVATAIKLWDRRKAQAKYGSVALTTFNHFVKGKGTVEEIVQNKSKRASVFGPCILAVSITWIKKGKASVDIFYRTTEFAKKFPADLVFIRDVLLKDFDFEGLAVEYNFHFANVTIHPMYMVTAIPHLDDPIGYFEQIKRKDKHFFDWTVKWTARYLCPEHKRGIEKFSQAMRVHKDAHERIKKPVIAQLQKYLRANHPGFRNDYDEDGDDE